MRRRGREINVFSVSALDLFASALGAFILISIVLMPYFLRVDRAVVEKLERDHEQASTELDSARLQLEQAQSELQQCQQREAACLQETGALREEMERLRGELAHAQSAAEEAQRATEQAKSDAEQAKSEAAQARSDAEQAESEAAQARSDAEQAESEAAQAKSEAEQARSESRQCRAEQQTCEARTPLVVVIQWITFDHDVDLYIIDPAGNEFSFVNRRFHGHPGELSVDDYKGPGLELWGASKAQPGEYQVLYVFHDHYMNKEKDPIVTGVVYFRDGHVKLRPQPLTKLKRPNATLAAIVTVNDDGSVEVFQP